MLDKREVINALYIISFSMYGIGLYVFANQSEPIGFVVSASVYLLIIIFYAIDIAYKRVFNWKLNRLGAIMLLYIISAVSALWVSLSKDVIHANPSVVYCKSALIILPFMAFVVVVLYNELQAEKLILLTFYSLGLLLLVNVVGYFMLGLENGVPDLSGRISFPFLDSADSGAGLVAIINLILLQLMQRAAQSPIKLIGILTYFIVNLILLFLIDAWIINVAFLVAVLLYTLNILKRMRLLFILSFFTIPLLLQAGWLIYRILSLPFFVFMAQRTKLVEFSYFNGRDWAWQRSIDWLIYDRQGILFGNGFNGHFFLHRIPDISRIWGIQEAAAHIHSTFLMVLVDQGIVGYTLLMLLFYGVLVFFEKKYQLRSFEGIFFLLVVFLLIVMQVDNFVLHGALGGVIFSFMIAVAACKEEHKLTIKTGNS